MLLDMLAKASSDEAVARVRDKFRAFVLPKEANESGQQTLFDMTAQIASAAISPSTSIQQADLAVLQWIADAGGETAKELLALLLSRTLYKRILVLSRDRVGDGTVLSALYSFHKDNKEKWWRRYNLQARLQAAVAKEVASSEAKHPELSSPIQEFLDHAKRSGLVLIDVPLEKTSGDRPLEYLVEEDRQSFKTDAVQSINLERSAVWGAIQQSFRLSIGKARVFCHPAHNAVLKACVDRQVLEAAIMKSLEEANSTTALDPLNQQ